MKSTTGPDGKRYQTFMILKKSFLMWLATIDANRVKSTVRKKLEAFQDRAVEALDLYFSGGPYVPRTMEEALIIGLEIERENKSLHRDINELKAKNAILMRQNAEMTPFYNLGRAMYERPKVRTIERFAKGIVINGKFTIGSGLIWKYLFYHRMLKNKTEHGKMQHQLPFEWCRSWFSLQERPQRRVLVTSIGEYEIVNRMSSDPDFFLWSREFGATARDRWMLVGRRAGSSKVNSPIISDDEW